MSRAIVSSEGVEFIDVKGANEPFIVSTNARAERARLPGASAEWDVTECQLRFYSSPDENWILYTASWRHHGVRAQELYHRKSGVAFEPFKESEWFAKAVRNYAIKNGGFKMTDFLEKRGSNVYENHLITKFQGWSHDSSRLLFGIYGAADYREDKREPFYAYFNTRTKLFEQTPYLRALNEIVAKSGRSRSPDVEDAACPEPIDPLPTAADLKARFDTLEAKLNETYAQRLTTPKELAADELRDEQQAWLKARDEGLKTYLAFAPKGEEERRRLQFLADVTAAQLEAFQPAWK